MPALLPVIPWLLTGLPTPASTQSPPFLFAADAGLAHDLDGDGVPEILVVDGTLLEPGKDEVRRDEPPASSLWVLDGASRRPIRRHVVPGHAFVGATGRCADLDGDGLGDYFATVVPAFAGPGITDHQTLVVYSGGRGEELLRFEGVHHPPREQRDVDGDGRGDLLLVTPGPENGATLRAVSPSGEERWSVALPADPRIVSTCVLPAAGERPGRVVVAYGSAGGIECKGYDGASGEPRGALRLEDRPGHQNPGLLVLSGGDRERAGELLVWGRGRWPRGPLRVAVVSCSAESLAVTRTWTLDEGEAACVTRDLDGDGAADVVFGDSFASTLRACSGTSGETLWRARLGVELFGFRDGLAALEVADGSPQLLLWTPQDEEEPKLQRIDGRSGAVLETIRRADLLRAWDER